MIWHGTDMEIAMKQKVRDWQSERIQAHEPLPDITEIRRRLGWKLGGDLAEKQRTHTIDSQPAPAATFWGRTIEEWIQTTPVPLEFPVP